MAKRYAYAMDKMRQKSHTKNWVKESERNEDKGSEVQTKQIVNENKHKRVNSLRP